MQTPTDIRATLRAAADLLARVKPIDMNVGDDPHGLAAQCRALADASPTVAELIHMVDLDHRVHFTDADGVEWMIVKYGRSGDVAFLFRAGDELGHGFIKPSDFGRPATLVEVTP